MMLRKFESLKNEIKSLGNLAVAFSAGTDSSFLLKIAHTVLGKQCMAFTISSCLISDNEINDAINFCKTYDISHSIIKIDPFKIDGFSKNPPDRCYICKKAILSRIISEAKSENFDFVAEGTNADDSCDYRPGFRAVKELGVKSPLFDVGLTKKEIRLLSKMEGLESAEKLPMPCLASRIPYCENITIEKLEMAYKAESFLQEYGFKNLRVRIHGENLARIEVSPEDIKRIIEKDLREKISESFKKIGFLYVSIDIDGYRTGSLNETFYKG